MYTLLLVILIVVSFSVLGYLAITRLNARVVVASLFAFGLVWLCGIAVLAEPPTDNPSVTVETVGETVNVFVGIPNAGDVWIRLQDEDGKYVANKIKAQKIGERSFLAFRVYKATTAVVFVGNKPVHEISL